MAFTIRQATRQGIIPLIGLWGGTGSGKTNSALLLARGMAGPIGRVGVIDTEGRRASYYADIIPGGFQAIDFDAPYSPERYIEAIELLEKSADVGVIDSASHAWEGPDGCLDLHEQVLDRMCGADKDDWRKRAALNWPAWREPKLRFQVLRNKILSLRIPLIVCFRGKVKSRMEKGSDNKNTVVKDDHTTPIFDDSFIFEMHVAVECYQVDGAGGFTRYPMPYAKTSHRDIRGLLPKEGEQLGITHGTALMKWCSTPGTGTVATTTALDPQKALVRELWAIAEPVRGKDKSWTVFEIWCNGQGVLTETEEVLKLTPDRLREVIEKTKEKLPK